MREWVPNRLVVGLFLRNEQALEPVPQRGLFQIFDFLVEKLAHLNEFPEEILIASRAVDDLKVRSSSNIELETLKKTGDNDPSHLHLVLLQHDLH